MASFLPCPSCGRHVRNSERACPFCGHANRGREIVGRSFSPLPEVLPALLLGLTLAACTGRESQPADTKAKTTSADSNSGASAGKDDGAEAGEKPRPAEKYGGPPSPNDEDFKAVAPEPEVDPTPTDDGSTIGAEPRPAEKYGGPPMDEPPELNDPKPKLEEDAKISDEPRAASKYGGPPKRPEPTPEKPKN